MLLPALTKAKLKATGISCMNNTKQLQLAHILYANDNEDYMLGPTAAPGLPDWCQVSASSMPQATDVARLKTTPTWSYLNSVASFHCPADKIPLSAGGVLVQPLRSYSMNVLIGKVPTPYAGIELALISSRIYRRSVKYSGFGHPGPSGVFVLWDEHENSINDEETFPFTGPQTLTHGTALTWLDAPSGRHGNAAGISFADGHAEIRKWKSDLTKVISPRQQGNGNVSFLPKVSQADWQWFPEHIASRGK